MNGSNGKRRGNLLDFENKLSKLHLDAVSICACGSNDYYAEVYKDVTKYYCKKTKKCNG